MVTLDVDEGQRVEAGESIGTIEAMKMEAAITTPIGGTVTRAAIGETQAVDGGDLLIVMGG